MTRTTEVSNSVESVSTASSICSTKSVTIWTVFHPLKKHSFPASLKRRAHGAMSCRKPTKVRKKIKTTSIFVAANSSLIL